MTTATICYVLLSIFAAEVIGMVMILILGEVRDQPFMEDPDLFSEQKETSL